MSLYPIRFLIGGPRLAPPTAFLSFFFNRPTTNRSPLIGLSLVIGNPSASHPISARSRCLALQAYINIDHDLGKLSTLHHETPDNIGEKPLNLNP